jgi:hypothetical protein
LSFAELAFGIVLVAVLVGLGLFFGRKQIQTLTNLGLQAELSSQDRVYLRRQTQRRLVCSILMLIFAGFLIGWFFLYRELEQVPKPAEGEAAIEHPLVRTITYYWIAALFVLFALLALASIDLIATARHGFRSVRRLENQRRAELEEEIARYRRQRTEMN